MRKLLAVCVVCWLASGFSWHLGCNRLHASRLQLLHAAPRTHAFVRDAGAQRQKTMQPASIMNQRTLPAKADAVQRRRKPGVAHILRAAKESKMATVGITTRDIDVILKDKRLPKSKAAKLIVAREKLTDFVTRVWYARRREPREFIPGMKVKGRVISLERLVMFLRQA